MSTDPSSKKQKLSLLAEKSQKNAPPATIDLLMQQEELWVNQILPCLGMGQFAFVGLVSKQMKHLYEEYCKTVEDPPAVVETLVYFPSDTRTRPATSTDTFYGATFCNLALAEYWHNYRYSKRYKMPWNSDVGETIAKLGAFLS
ncbi:expressed unknown protein [Seminavis robusta]|uniref:Uncharacterized protein n=1 Tax=Seminavis robusta TaxID=568900 RepID=A0A9N8H0E9_9STRA|nr:expressed unknown protein [Seminavis robusta]|eukprot:Sro1_g000550.1 n/a (144) ;mRNA; f:159537-159968